MVAKHDPTGCLIDVGMQGIQVPRSTSTAEHKHGTQANKSAVARVPSGTWPAAINKQIGNARYATMQWRLHLPKVEQW